MALIFWRRELTVLAVREKLRSLRLIRVRGWWCGCGGGVEGWRGETSGARWTVACAPRYVSSHYMRYPHNDTSRALPLERASIRFLPPQTVYLSVHTITPRTPLACTPPGSSLHPSLVNFHPPSGTCLASPPPHPAPASLLSPLIQHLPRSSSPSSDIPIELILGRLIHALDLVELLLLSLRRVLAPHHVHLATSGFVMYSSYLLSSTLLSIWSYTLYILKPG